MAKSLRSNNKKALRTVRRKKLQEDPKWQADAEAKRQAVMARILAAPHPSAERRAAEAAASMDVEAAAVPPPDADAAAMLSNAVETAAASVQPMEGDGLVKSPGKIHLTKKKAMKLKRLQRQTGHEAWKRGTVKTFHARNKKKKRSA